jgi:hypothetical protein
MSPYDIFQPSSTARNSCQLLRHNQGPTTPRLSLRMQCSSGIVTAWRVQAMHQSVWLPSHKYGLAGCSAALEIAVHSDAPVNMEYVFALFTRSRLVRLVEDWSAFRIWGFPRCNMYEHA